MIIIIIVFFIVLLFFRFFKVNNFFINKSKDAYIHEDIRSLDNKLFWKCSMLMSLKYRIYVNIHESSRDNYDKLEMKMLQ